MIAVTSSAKSKFLVKTPHFSYKSSARMCLNNSGNFTLQKMLIFLSSFILFFLAKENVLFAKNISTAITQPIPLAQLPDYAHYPQPVKALITEATILSKKNLTYLYGSDDPKNLGMDCSGTMYYLLHKKLTTVPRSSDDMFHWVEKKGKLYRVTANTLSSSQFSHLKPGDLLFWSGTYASHNNITHVMLYLGKNEKNEPLMFGSSDGRVYQGKKMWGVSVFDFTLPSAKEKAKFVGYSCIPDLTCEVSPSIATPS